MKKLFFLTLALLIMGAASVYAYDIQQYYFEGEFEPTDTENIKSSGRTSDSAVALPSPSIVSIDGDLSDAPVTSISIEALYTSNVQTYNIPLSYGFPLSLTGNKELLNFKLVLPYTVREVGSTSDSGLGDISLSTNYLIRFPNFLLDSKLVVKAPTGEFKDADIPLGTGSTDVGAYFNGSYYMDRMIFRGGLGYGYNGTYDQTGDEIDYGDEYIVSGGMDYKITDTLRAGGLLVYKSRAEDELDIAGVASYVSGVNSLDLVPSAVYLYSRFNLELVASMTIPITSSWNTDKGFDPADDPDKDIAFSVSCSKPF